MSWVEESVVINAPIGECFRMWSQPECLPCFMNHVERAWFSNNQIYWHWKVEDSAGRVLEWDTAIDSMEENRFISWHSVENALADTSGVVNFHQTDDQTTRINIEMMFNPPAKAGGEFVADFFTHPEKMVREDLNCLKHILEQKPTLFPGEKGE